MATAELAVALTAVVVALSFGLSAIVAGVDLLRVTDAARVGARAAARGDAPGRVQELVAAGAPRGATVTVSRGDGEVVVRVSSSVRGPVGAVWGADVVAEAVAASES